jgi:uncharacterized membrane-anchored protein
LRDEIYQLNNDLKQEQARARSKLQIRANVEQQSKEAKIFMNYLRTENIRLQQQCRKISIVAKSFQVKTMISNKEIEHMIEFIPKFNAVTKISS